MKRIKYEIQQQCNNYKHVLSALLPPLLYYHIPLPYVCVLS